MIKCFLPFQIFSVILKRFFIKTIKKTATNVYDILKYTIGNWRDNGGLTKGTRKFVNLLHINSAKLLRIKCP